jgi:hypothetical protein
VPKLAVKQGVSQMSQRPIIMVFSGYNIRGVVAFCRWAKEHKVDYCVIARSAEDPIFLTRYRSRVAVVRSSSALGPEELLGWAELLRKQTASQKVLILPSTEYLNRTLLAHRDVLEAGGCVVPLVGVELYEKLSNKESFARTCADHGICIPVEFPSLPLQVPFVAKPRAYAAASGRQLIPQLILSEESSCTLGKRRLCDPPGARCRRYWVSTNNGSVRTSAAPRIPRGRVGGLDLRH